MSRVVINDVTPVEIGGNTFCDDSMLTMVFFPLLNERLIRLRFVAMFTIIVADRIYFHLNGFCHDCAEHVWQLCDGTELVGDLLTPLLLLLQKVNLIYHGLENDLKHNNKKI